VKIKGLRVDPSSGMERLSVRRVGRARSCWKHTHTHTCTRTHTHTHNTHAHAHTHTHTTHTDSNLCPLAVDCHVKHVDSQPPPPPPPPHCKHGVPVQSVTVGPVWPTDSDTRSGCSPEDGVLSWSANVTTPDPLFPRAERLVAHEGEPC